jgi:lysophospholipase L1-like esterase
MRKRIFLFSSTASAMLIIIASLFLSCTKRPVEQAPFVSFAPDTTHQANADVKSYLALGDSYTIGQSVPASDRYPVQAVAALRNQGFNIAEPEIIATTGWTTGNLLTALKDKTVTKPYDLVTLLIGVNNQDQQRSIEEYRSEFTTLLNKSIQYAGNKPEHVIVISIPDYSVTPYAAGMDNDKIAKAIDAFNAVNKEISTAAKVNYVDVTTESRKAANDASLIAGDGLHFSGIEYKRWTELLLPVINVVLK